MLPFTIWVVGAVVPEGVVVTLLSKRLISAMRAPAHSRRSQRGQKQQVSQGPCGPPNDRHLAKSTSKMLAVMPVLADRNPPLPGLFFN